MFNKSYFVLFINEYEGTLFYVEDQKILAETFGTLEETKQEFDKIFSKNKNAIIQIILKDQDKDFSKEIIKASTSSERDHIVKQKLQQNYNESNFRGMIDLSETDSIEEQEYLFITINKTKAIDSWFEYISGLGNRLEGIYSFDLEVKGLVNYLLPKETQKKWQIMINHKEYYIYKGEEFLLKDKVTDNLTESIDNSLVKVNHMGELVNICIIGFLPEKLYFDDHVHYFTFENLKGLLKIKDELINFEQIICLAINKYDRKYKLYNSDLSQIKVVKNIYYYTKLLFLLLASIGLIISSILWGALDELLEEKRYMANLRKIKEMEVQQIKKIPIEVAQDDLEVVITRYSVKMLQDFFAKVIALKNDKLHVTNVSFEFQDNQPVYIINLEFIVTQSLLKLIEIKKAIEELQKEFQDYKISYVSSDNQAENIVDVQVTLTPKK